VTVVELFIDGLLAGRSTSAPYSMTIKHPSPGAHTLQLKAYDAAGNVGLSAPITVYR
jgi:hypothetical protein